MMPKEEAFSSGTGYRSDRDIGLALEVEVHHLAHVHAVHVVGGEDRDDVGGVRLQKIEVLVHRVGGALGKAAGWSAAAAP